jgi:hypothetical protein
MRTRFAPVLVLVFLTVGGLSCRCAKAGGGSKDPYVVKPSLQKTDSGMGKASVLIEVADGWHWNAEFPFSMQVQEQKGTDLGKTQYGVADVQVARGGTSATVNMGVTGKIEAGARMKGIVSFGVCDEKVCSFCRKCAIEWTVGGAAP